MMTTFEITAHEEGTDTSVSIDLDYLRDLGELEVRLSDQLAATTCIENHYWMCVCNEDDPVTAQVEQEFIAAVRKRQRLDTDRKAVSHVLRRLHEAMVNAKLPCHHEADCPDPVHPASWTSWTDHEDGGASDGDSPVGTPSSHA
jgi:Arc/MetJ family transcription regulator